VPKGDPFNDEDRKVQIQFLENKPYIVELISPLDNCSPVSGILKKWVVARIVFVMKRMIFKDQ